MTIFEARPRRQPDGRVRFLCGRIDLESGPCRGHVGDANSENVTQPDGSVTSEWVLWHPFGLYLDGDVYRVIPPERDRATGQAIGRKIGRRPRPDRLAVLTDTREAIGRIPALPAMVVCPRCGRHNRLDNPTSMV